MGVPRGRHDTRRLWGLYEMYETLWFCLMSVSDGAFSVLVGSLAHFRTIRLYVWLVVNGTTTFTINIPSRHGCWGVKVWSPAGN